MTRDRILPATDDSHCKFNQTDAFLVLSLAGVWIALGAAKVWAILIDRTASSAVLLTTSAELVIGISIVNLRTRKIAVWGSLWIAVLLLTSTLFFDREVHGLEADCGCLGKVGSLGKSVRAMLAVGLSVWSFAAIRLTSTRPVGRAPMEDQP